jgi:NAD+ kinase
MRVVGLFFRKDREHCSEIARAIESADYGGIPVKFVRMEPDEGLAGNNSSGVEFAISIGGDGTFLRVARAAHRLGIPLYGVNAGRLGFLAPGEPEEAPGDIARILSGKYDVVSIMPLRCELRRGSDGGPGEKFYALNEMTLSKGPVLRPIGLLVLAGGEVLYRFLADGVIVSTPTGSTAYSLSAGGPIVHPDVSCLIVTPICPHSLYPRPVVLGANETVEIRLDGDCEMMNLSGDGILDVDVRRKDSVRISLSKSGVNIIKLDYASYYEALRRKLNWEPESVRHEGF